MPDRARASFVQSRSVYSPDQIKPMVFKAADNEPRTTFSYLPVSLNTNSRREEEFSDRIPIEAFHRLFNQNISGWDVSGVFEFFRMFAGATIFNQNLSSWPVIEFAYAENIFCNSAILGQTLKYPPFSPPPNKWGC